MARPVIPYDEELTDYICERIATSELGLEQVLQERQDKQLSYVSSTTIYKWLNEVPEFAEKSARARKMQAELLHDRAQQVAQSPLIGRIEKHSDKDGATVTISDNVERSKLIVQTLLKRAGQLDSKKYGDKVQAEVSGAGGGPIQAAIAVTFVKAHAVDADNQG